MLDVAFFWLLLCSIGIVVCLVAAAACSMRKRQRGDVTMDLRTGKLYPDLAAALADGVPESHAVEIERLRKAAANEQVLNDTMKRRGKEAGDFVRVTKGPFKGRVYQRLSGQVRRRRDLEIRGDQEER